MVALNPLFSVPFNIINAVEMLEGANKTSFLLKKKDGSLSARRIFIARTALLVVVYLITLVSTNVAIIFDVVGAVFGPAIGFIIPVFFEN